MTSWEKIKADPVLKEKNNNYMRSYLKNKYDCDESYKAYMKEKARARKSMLREQKRAEINNNS